MAAPVPRSPSPPLAVTPLRATPLAPTAAPNNHLDVAPTLRRPDCGMPPPTRYYPSIPPRLCQRAIWTGATAATQWSRLA
jgi:hypothetical protein